MKLLAAVAGSALMVLMQSNHLTTKIEVAIEFGHLNRGDSSPQNNPDAPRKSRIFSPEFKREFAQGVIDQNYTVYGAAKAMNVGVSTMINWVKQL